MIDNGEGIELWLDENGVNGSKLLRNKGRVAVAEKTRNGRGRGATTLGQKGYSHNLGLKTDPNKGMSLFRS
ncbi:unnamed protein product [Cochlearia groenlandica]